MLKEASIDAIWEAYRAWVLILILMEHAQRAAKAVLTYKPYNYVLILILMEHAQRVGGLPLI